MHRLEGLLHIIDTVNEWIGRIFSLLLLPMVFIVAFEVVARYVFDRPTIWAWDLNLQLFGVLIMMGAGYTFLWGRHISVDIVVEHMPSTAKKISNLIASLFVLLVLAILIWQGGEEGIYSIQTNQRISSIWHPPAYTLKMAIPIGASLMALQVLAKLFRDIGGWSRGNRNGRELS